jgi:anti-anti-sigma regulatory factor
MDAGTTPGGRAQKPVTNPQSGVFTADLLGNVDGKAAAAPLQLTILPLQADTITRVKCEGILSLRGRPVGSDPLRDLFGAQCFTHKVLMSLEKVVGAETSGVAWLFLSGQKFQAAGGKLVIFSIPATVQSMLTLLEVDHSFFVASTETEARNIALAN